MREGKQRLYLNMIFGSVGLLLVALAAMRYIAEGLNSGNNGGYLIVLFGFIFTMNYVNFLEEKAGVSKKITWVRAIISIILLFVISYYLFF
ncbi:hypothetical protein [Bacillus sp. AK031]